MIANSAMAVNYELNDINGNKQSLSQYKGKWVIAHFWATWCRTCLKELPDLIQLHNNNKESDIVVVGINFESIDNKRLKQFVNDKSIPFTVLNTEPVSTTPLGPVPALPTTYIMNPEGKVIAGEIGLVPSESLESFIKLKKGQRAKLASIK